MSIRRIAACMAIWAMALWITSCATVPLLPVTEDAEAKQFRHNDDAAVLYVYRNEWLGAAVPHIVRVDGKSIGQLASKTYFRVGLPVGKHSIETGETCTQLPSADSSCKQFSLGMEAFPGQVYFIRLETKLAYGNPAILHRVDPETGEKAVLECALAQSGEQSLPRQAAQDSAAAMKIQRLPPKVLSPSLFSTQDPVHLLVRSATQADLEGIRHESDQEMAASMVVFGAGSVGLGLSVAPMYGASMVLGGVLVGIGATAIMIVEGGQQNEIELALKQTGFVDMLRQEFVSTLDTSPRADNPITLEVVPLRYGVMEAKGRDELCAAAEIAVTLSTADQALYRDKVLISPYLRSTDAPPPVCLPRRNMAEDSARALRDALAEYAVTIAAIVRQRMAGLPWKP